MHSMALRNGRAALLFVLAYGALPTWGCDILGGGDPDSARVLIEGAVGHPILLVTTSDFDVVSNQSGEDQEVYVFSADTTEVASPFDRRYSLGPRHRFYAILTSETTPAEAVTVRVFIDGDRRYNRSTRFGEEVLEFLYISR